MSRKSPKGAQAESKKTRAQTQRSYWRQSGERWLELLQGVGATHVHRAGPNKIKLCCPYHADTTPSGVIDLERGYFKCFACSKYETNPVRFLGQFIPGGYVGAISEFRRHFTLAYDKSFNDEDLTAEEQTQKRLRLINEVLYDYLCDVWTADQTPETTKSALAWLRGRRIDDVQGLGSLGLMPRMPAFERIAMQKGATQDDLTWCKRFLMRVFTPDFVDSVVFTYAISPDHITGFKFRAPNKDKSDPGAVVFLLDEHVQQEHWIGGFGLLTPAYYPYYNHESVQRFYAVEGEFDQIALYMEQARHGQVNDVCIAFGGNGHRGLSFMSELGFRECRLVGDDDAAGHAYPKTLMPQSKGLNFLVFTWPQAVKHPQGGYLDPDEAIHVHGFEKFYEALSNPDNYYYAVRWCLERAKVELQGIHPENVQGIQEVAAAYVALLPSDLEKETFAQEFQLLCPQVPAGNAVRASFAQHDNALGFTARIYDKLKTIFEATDWNIETNELRLWHCEKKMFVSIKAEESTMFPKFISLLPGGDLHAWVKHEIGLPGYMQDPFAPDAVEGIVGKVESSVRSAFMRALHRFTAEAMQNLSPEEKGQGIHLEMAPKKNTGYLVNGKQVFKFQWNEERTKVVHCEELRAPVDGSHRFDLEPHGGLIPFIDDGWTELVKRASDLLDEPAYTAEDTFKRVFRIINENFGFEHQEVDALYCTALLFYNHLYDIISGRRMLTHFTAEYESGKTTIMSLIAGHHQHRGINLCDHGRAPDQFTQAAFQQWYCNTRLVACLDEMNDKSNGTRDSEKKRDFYMKTRSLATSGSMTVAQGSADGRGRSYIIRNSIITASGSLIHDEMDESRYNTIYMKKDPRRGSVVSKVEPIVKDGERLRRSVLLNSLHKAPLVHAEYHRLRAELSKRALPDEKSATPAFIMDRFAENLMPAAAILTAFGIDGVKFLERFRASRQKQTSSRVETSPGHSLIDLILATPFTYKDDLSGTTTIKALLLSASQREDINRTRQGVYYDATTQSLVLCWPEIKVAFRAPQLKMKPAPAFVFELKTATQWVMPHDEAIKKGVFDRMKPFGFTHRPELCSVIMVGKNVIDPVSQAVQAQSLIDMPPHPADSSKSADFIPGL